MWRLAEQLGAASSAELQEDMVGGGLPWPTVAQAELLDEQAGARRPRVVGDPGGIGWRERDKDEEEEKENKGKIYEADMWDTLPTQHIVHTSTPHQPDRWA